MEASLARLADRDGRAPGIVFRITRASVLLGGKVIRVLETLFEMPAAKSAARAALLKKPRAAGVFLDDQSGMVARPERPDSECAVVNATFG